MPPTLPAARNTACGRFSANHLNTAAWSRRSSSPCVAVSSSTFSAASRRSSAEPTIPLCPATKTVLPFSSNGVFAIGDLSPGDRKVARHHLLDQFGEGCFRLPAEHPARLAGVADQLIDFGGAKIHRIDAHKGLSRLRIDAGLLDALAAPHDAAADFGERDLDEFAYRAGLTGCQHEIVRYLRLQDLVHALDIVPGMAPVASRLEISQIERVFQTDLDPGDAAGNLAGDESFAADRAFMIEQDAVAGKHAVGLAVIHRDPVTVELGDAIGRAWIERRGFPLRGFLH